MQLETKLKDILEKDVDEKYYISDAMLNYFMGVNQKPSKFPRGERFMANMNRKNQDIANTITTNPGQRPTDNFIRVKTANKQWYDLATVGDGVDLQYPKSETRRGRVGHGVSKTIMTGGAMGVVVDEPFCVASRGRNPENPSDRTPGQKLEQRLEPKFDGTTNTITTVQKDNYVAIPNLKTRLCNELVRCGVVKGGEIINHSYTTSEQRDTLDKYIETTNGITPTLTTRPDILGYVEDTPLRIRKLTPLETWKLMGFSEEDFRKAEKVNSNAQLYKQAGNSIVCNVLMAIFKNLL